MYYWKHLSALEEMASQGSKRSAPAENKKRKCSGGEGATKVSLFAGPQFVSDSLWPSQDYGLNLSSSIHEISKGKNHLGGL